MKYSFSRLIFTLIQLLFLSTHVFAAINLSEVNSGQLIGHKTTYFIDDQAILNTEQVKKLSKENWTKVNKEIISLGYSDVALWIKVELINPSIGISPSTSLNNSDWFIEIAYPVLDKVGISIFYEDRIETFSLGDRESFNVRPIEHRNFVIPTSLKTGETAEVFIRVESGTSLQVPIKLWKQTDFYDQEQSSLIWQGIYFGCFFVVVFYNLCLFYYSRQRQYLYFAFVFGSFVLFQSTLAGISYQYLWPDSPQWNEHALPIFLGLVLVSESIFILSFLELKKSLPKLAKLLVYTSTAAAAISLASIFISYHISILCLIVAAILINFVGFIAGIKQSIEGSRAAQFFTFAWAGTLFGGILLAFSKLGILERNVITENALQIGTTFSIIWLSFALGEYIAQQNKERNKAKQNALDYALKIAEERQEKLSAQDEILALQKSSNHELEILVKQRTVQLEQIMVDLEKANSRLEHISNLDELTGIYNRRYFNQKFDAEFKRAHRQNQSISFLMIDVDHFKSVNDNYGHLVGDICLKRISKLLSNSISRPNDILSRFGGEEFVIVLPDTTFEGATFVANRLLKSVEAETVIYEDISIKLTVSIGLATLIPKDNDRPQSIILAADNALYEAKESGRNCLKISTIESPL
jgi:diguanylate cyclase